MKIASLVFVVCLCTFGQEPGAVSNGSISPANPEMDKLARVFVGEWTTTESFARNDFYPNGATRKGKARFRLATGGTSLIEEVDSDGSAGKLNFMVVIWWDKDQNIYHFFTCGNGGNDPCRVRGNAQWDGSSFLNEYELTIRGARRKWRDRFFQISSRSVTLTAEMESDKGVMETMITTKYTR